MIIKRKGPKKRTQGQQERCPWEIHVEGTTVRKKHLYGSLRAKQEKAKLSQGPRGIQLKGNIEKEGGTYGVSCGQEE